MPLSFRKNHLSGALQVCRIALRKKFVRNETNLKNQDEVIDAIKGIGSRKSDLFLSTSWLGVPVSRRTFKLVSTEKGSCYSFNMLNSRSIFTDA